jgi:hypothetical protein
VDAHTSARNPGELSEADSRLSSPVLPGALSFAAAACTAVVAAGILFGWGTAAGVAAVSVVALVAALRGPLRAGGAVLGSYVLVIVAKLAADSARYGFDMSDPLRHVPGASAGTAGSSGQFWLLGLAVAPVCVMLLGGYLIGRGHPAGSILAWWTPLLAAADGLWTLVAVPWLDWDRPGPAIVVVALALGEVLVATRGVQALLRQAVPAAPSAAGLTTRQRNLWTVLIVALVVVYGASLWQQAGLLPLGVIVGSMMGGLVGWRKTTSRVPADPAYHVPLFLLMLALFYLHVGEEGLTGFNRAVASISGHEWRDGPFTLLIGLLGPTVWVFGAWSLWKRQPFGNFIYWFMVVGMIIGEPTHLLVFPVMKMWQTGGGYGYFSGMYTALFPMVPALIALPHIILRDRADRTSRSAQIWREP